MAISDSGTRARLAVATYASVIANHAKWLGGGEWTIWYIGSDYTRLVELRQKVNARFAPVAEVVNAAAKQLLPLILDLDGAVGTPNFDRHAWNVSDLGERSRFNSPFFLETARILAFLNGSGEGRRLAVTDDEAFAMCVLDTAKANGRDIDRLGVSLVIARMRNVAASGVRAAKTMISETRGALRRRRICRRLRERKPLSVQEAKAVDVWIVVWATDRTFTPNGPLEREDRAGRLPHIVRSGGLRPGYIVLPLWPEHYEAMARNALSCSEPVLFVEDALRPGDIFRALSSALRPLRGAKRALSWNGINLNPLLSRAVFRERTSGRPVKVDLFRTLPRLLRQMGASPKSIVTTYENHSWEKVLTAAVRTDLRATQVVGHNHALVSSYYVSMNPSPGEIAANAIPDRLITLGDYTAEGLAARGFPRERLAVVGGLRYEDFFARTAQIPALPYSQVRHVLCCVGVDLDEGIELVKKGAEAVSCENNLSLIVNFHPMSGPEYREAVKRGLRASNTKGFESIRFDDRPVRELLGEAHFVLYIDSNAALEAAAAGRSIIYVVRETGIEFDKMPLGLAQHCRTPEDIRAALLSESPHRAEDVRDLLAHAIAPVDADKILDIVGARVCTAP